MSDAEVLATLKSTLPHGQPGSYDAIRNLAARDIVESLVLCGVNQSDCGVVAANWGTFRNDPDLVDALAALDTWLATNFALVEPDFPIWDDLFEQGESGRYLYLYASALGATRVSDYLESLGASPAVTADTLKIVSRHVAVYKMKWNELGTDAGWWLLLMLRGVLLQCGSLQFHRVQLGKNNLAPNPWYSQQQMDELGEGFALGDESFGIHIPQSTNLSPTAVDDSLALATSQLNSIWPNPKRRLFTLQSWLLDPQLRDCLSPDSNIVQFQNRFTVLDNAPIADEDTVEFVFRSPKTELAELPRRSSLERGVLDLLNAGGHWYATVGWLK